VPNRQEILEEHGLFGAPAWRQQAFWRTYNLQRRRRSTGALGDLAAKAVSDQALGRARLLGRVRSAWQTVLPPQYAARCEVESFRRGRLLVAVDSATTKYVLSRQLGEALRTLMNDYLGASLVHSIGYRIAGAASGDVAGSTSGRTRGRTI
jgi:hypothetical protein